MGFYWWRGRLAALIGFGVLAGLFKLDLLSAGWNIVLGLVITAALYVVTGLIESD